MNLFCAPSPITMNQSELAHLVSSLRITVGRKRKLPDASLVGYGVGLQRLRKRVSILKLQ